MDDIAFAFKHFYLILFAYKYMRSKANHKANLGLFLFFRYCLLFNLKGSFNVTKVVW